MSKSVILAAVMITALFSSAVRAETIEPEFRTNFVAVSYHNVVDNEGELSGETVTTDSLIQFFEWLRGNNWHPISLDDLEQARIGKKSLPENAILITFDDGYRSLYTRVYPLVLAYKFPIVAAITGRWMDAPMGESVPYGDQTNLVPRSEFVSWDEVREMQQSGLVEIASHSYDLHTRDQLSNPQGNRLSPATNREYYSDLQSYEGEREYRARIRADMIRMRVLLKRELGRAPRAMVWPFGRYNMLAIEEAKKSGYTFSLTLDSEPASADRPFEIDRYILSGNPELGDVAAELKFAPVWPNSQRLVALNPASIYSPDPVEFNNRLGLVIERIHRIGVTKVLLDAAVYSDDGTIEATWFPTKELPLKADILSRMAVQIDRREGCRAVIRLPHLAALATLKSEERVVSLFNDLGVAVVTDGLLIEGAHLPRQAHSEGETLEPVESFLWTVRAARNNLDLSSLSSADQLAWHAFRAVEYHRPRLTLTWLLAKNSTIDEMNSSRAVADVTLIPSDWPHLDEIEISRNLGLWISGESPPDDTQVVSAVRQYQIRGGRIFGWSPDDPLGNRPSAEAIAPSISTSWFPESR